MNETGTQAGGAQRPHTSETIDAFCDALRGALHNVSRMVTPPESAKRHFREARIEMLRGFRELIDLRIERLSRKKQEGTKVVVE